MDRNLEQESLTRRGLLKSLTGLAVAVLGGTGAWARGLQKKSGAAEWDSKMELAIDFEISQAEGGRYHRPYVAVWLDDSAGKAVRTLSLWVENSGRGPRWIPDLRRWYRDTQDEEGPDLIATLSSATRNPGKYSLIWDGKDDRGKLVPQGLYTLSLESAREHGPYGLVQKQIAIGPKPVKFQVEGNADIKGATVDYRKRA